MKYVYKYDERTKEYLGKAEALLDPLETQLQQKEIYLLPVDATFSAPTLQEGYVSVFKEGAWENIEDNRGKEYWLKDDVYGAPAREMKELGPLPEGATLKAPERTLDEVKADKVQRLKAERDAREVEPITYNGNSYDYDDKARERINAAIIALDVQGADASIDWTTADNADVKVTANDLRMVIAMVANRSNALHIAYREAKDKVEQAITVAEVEAITLNL
nr:MAG TPA: tail fiber assembly protein [Caudoviricetes sp.]